MLHQAEERPTPEQQVFLDHAMGRHAILVAGPGTGKTWTLAKAAEGLTTEHEVRAEDIALLTLTRSMSVSMAQRIPHGHASTLHSFALTLLNRIGEARNRRIADSWEQDNLIRKDVQAGIEAQFREKVKLPDIDDFFDRLATAFRNDQQEPPNLSPTETRILSVINSQKELFRYRLLDELVRNLLSILESGQRIANPPQYVLVDEYQDLTAGELRLLNILFDQYGTRLIACGDDRQSIFGFRAADPFALHRFCPVYHIPNPDYLSRTRRCPALICSFAERMAQPLTQLPGIDRPILQPIEGRADTGSISIYSAPSPIAEARWVMQNIIRLVAENGYSPHEIMIIIAGYKKQVLPKLNEAFAELTAPPFTLYDPSGFDPIAETMEVRLLNAGVHLIQDPEDQLSWRTLVWATPGLGDVRDRNVLLAGNRSYLENLRAIAATDDIVRRAVTAGDNIIRMFPRDNIIPASELINRLATDLGLDVNAGVIQPFIDRVGQESNAKKWINALFELSLKTLTPPESRPRDIPIRTIFGAKGLEAKVVFVINAIPHCFNRSGDVADGIRQLYVAITRPRERLLISAPRNLRYTPLEHVTNATYGGLFQNLTDTAAQLHIPITH